MLMDKKQDYKDLRIRLNEADFKLFKEQAEEEHLSLATWARQKLLFFVNGRAFNED